MSKVGWQHVSAKVWSYVWWFPIFWPLVFPLWIYRQWRRIITALYNLLTRAKAEASKASCTDSLPTDDVLPPFIILAWLILQVVFVSLCSIIFRLLRFGTT